MTMVDRPHQLNRRKRECKAIIETVRGGRCKISYDPDYGAFTASQVLAEGFSFPFDFGFIPSTLAEDGDPIDVLLLMDVPLFPGCATDVRLVGVIEAMQKESGKEERNDRLLAVATVSRQHARVRKIGDLNPDLIQEIEQFFVFYNRTRGREFRVLARRGPQEAVRLVEKAIARFQKSRSK
jgi:inorganic pyrophosphatase